ncbi:MAG: sodium:alanine symporter family protein [Bifidobacteriaceae bacterium]|jgi:AGCS family alanine or glycine:cation symporter|nr:sodium:alanine symporter family protein [Bifidobacteriaceae bacterium]
METLSKLISTVDGFVWGPQLLIPLLFVTGLVLTIRLGGVQFTKLGAALRLGLLKRKDAGSQGDISHYQALTTALAATVGVGNIVGVSTAICVGGPGALFWMWVTGLLGMASKYAEAFLGSKYREIDAKGEVMGGPQIYLEKAIKGKIGKTLAILFSIFGALAAFGIGNMTQVHAVTTNIKEAFGIPPVITGLVVLVLVGAVLIGGIKSIGRVTAGFVPFMIIVYLIGGLVVLVLNADGILPALGSVFHDAFTGTAAGGGFLGAGVALAIQKGMARGIFSNESGMGSAAIVAAAAKTTHPVRQGLVSMTQTFIDTIIVVSFTGLIILSTGSWQPINVSAAAVGKKGYDTGQATAYGFYETFNGKIGAIIVAVCVAFFALSTILGWSYYGERCATRLLGLKAQLPYRVIFTIMIMAGALWQLEPIWNLADILNGLMALPNLVGLLILSGLIARETKAYLAKDPDLSKGGIEPEQLVALDIKWVPAESIVAKR